MPHPAITTKQAAARSGIPRRTILHAILRGDLPAEKFGDGHTSAYMIRERDLDRWLEQREQASA